MDSREIVPVGMEPPELVHCGVAVDWVTSYLRFTAGLEAEPKQPQFYPFADRFQYEDLLHLDERLFRA